MIFPVGKYKSVYSENIKDLYTETSSMGDLNREDWMDEKRDGGWINSDKSLTLF
jgi:hypothetical protein